MATRRFDLLENIAKELVINAMNQAILLRGTIKGLIFHSDKGSQYTSHDFQDFLGINGIRSSMSAKGSCYDNACAESFFHTLKTEQTSTLIFKFFKMMRETCLFISLMRVSCLTWHQLI